MRSLSTLMNVARQPVLRLHLKNAPVPKIEAPDLNAAGNDVVADTLELAHEGLTVDCPGA